MVKRPWTLMAGCDDLGQDSRVIGGVGQTRLQHLPRILIAAMHSYPCRDRSPQLILRALA